MDELSKENIEPANVKNVWRKRLIQAAKRGIILLVAWGITHTLIKTRQELAQHSWSLSPGWLVLSGLLYTLAQIPSWYLWHRAIRVLGQEPDWRTTLRAFFIGHLGKYVPGKAMVVIIRAGMAQGKNVDPSVAAACVFLETLTTMSCAAIVGGLIVTFYLDLPWYLSLAAWGTAAATGLPTWPPLFEWLLRRIGAWTSGPALKENLRRLDSKTILIGWGGITLGWLLMGLSLWAAIRGVQTSAPLSLEDFLRYTAAVSLATSVGFVSLIPAGAGIREVVIQATLSPISGQGLALAHSLVLRLIWLVAELLLSIILYIWRPDKGRSLADFRNKKLDELASPAGE